MVRMWKGKAGQGPVLIKQKSGLGQLFLVGHVDLSMRTLIREHLRWSETCRTNTRRKRGLCVEPQLQPARCTLE